ncbi:PspA/IM30 family protein [Thalassolituus pacificus]|jgi:phage shock protein A|uniref:PspA/IM30 family protein n=1 Tax=Thalassolituus pacificus TaxID=2975440 RepID=A0A9X3AS27_9GAMM|nr:PspA/IM30 family protein [Thalassolituus pacificus]MCT7359915.1 PspA/IM30 family protein [Thalassolituus pacificus]
MSEGLLKRIGRLVSASANSLVDSLENAAPTLVMEEAIREIDSAIADVRSQLGKVEAARYLSTKSLNSDNSRHAELQAQIEVAVAQSRDDLAEAAIARQMDIEAMIPVVEKSIADSDAEINELNSYIQALQAKKREMQEALKHYEIANAAAVQAEHAATPSTATQVEQATDAFNRILNKAGAPGVSSGDESKLAELDQLARQNRIQERLARVKSQAND